MEKENISSTINNAQKKTDKNKFQFFFGDELN